MCTAYTRIFHLAILHQNWKKFHFPKSYDKKRDRDSNANTFLRVRVNNLNPIKDIDGMKKITFEKTKDFGIENKNLAI